MMEVENPGKFDCLFKIFRFISRIKGETKLDYFSNKTFLALRAASEQELERLHSVFRSMYEQSKSNFDVEKTSK